MEPKAVHVGRVAGLAILYVVLAVGLDLSSGYYVMQTGLAICYPPSGLYLAAILLLGWRALPLAFLNPCFSLLVTLRDQHIPWQAVLSISAASMISPALLLAASSRAFFPRGRLDSFQGVCGFVLMACLAVGLESLVSAGAYVGTGLTESDEFGMVAWGWWVSNVLPYLALTPGLLWIFHRPATARKMSRLHSVGWHVLIAFVAWLSMWSALSYREGEHSHRLYVAFLPILFSALSFGIHGAAWSSLLVTATALILAPAHLGSPHVLVEAQAFLVVVSIAGLLTGAVVNERRHSVAALAESERLYRSLLDVTGTGFVMLDTQGRVLEANEEYLRLTGRARLEEILGRYVVDWTAPEDRERNAREVLKCLETGRVRNLEIRYVKPDGSSQPLEINAAVVRMGHEDRILTLCMDIRDRQRMEERLRQSEKLQAVGQLAGGIAHDFNNQLTGVVGFADILARQLENPRHREFAELILRAAKRAGDLTRQILAFGRKGKFQIVSLDLNQVVDEVVELLKHSIDKRIRIAVHGKASAPVIEGDPTQVQNAILNLALNARDAMPEGGNLVFEIQDVRLGVEVCEAQTPPLKEGRYVLVSVTDTGCGMAAETRKHLFEPFFTTKAPGKGTGMGLAAVYGTVRSHHGMVTIDSEPGRGTTVKVYLPRSESAPTSEGTEHPPTATACARILIVDDEEIVRTLAVEMLRGEGHQTVTCKDGLEGVERYRQSWRELDLVILDLVMPGMTGRDLFRALREINPRVKVVISSGFSVDGEAQRLLEDGALGFIQKPFQLADLNKVVADALRT